MVRYVEISFLSHLPIKFSIQFNLSKNGGIIKDLNKEKTTQPARSSGRLLAAVRKPLQPAPWQSKWAQGWMDLSVDLENGKSSYDLNESGSSNVICWMELEVIRV